jgi:hypothetical protein
MEVTGVLMKKVGEREGVSQRTGQAWKTAEFLLEIPGQYPRHINFSVRDGLQQRIARFESLMGKTVMVSFDLDAHEFEGRWFNDVQAWGIMEYVVGGGRAQQSQTNNQEEQKDDIPFPPPAQ